jgi:hypothetical protein
MIFFNDDNEISDIDFENQNNTLVIDQYYLDAENLVSNTSRINYRASANIEKEKFKRQTTQLLKESVYDYGFSSSAENFIREKMDENGVYYREWLNEIYIENIDDESMLVALLRVVSHFEYDEVYPIGMTIAAAALNHKSNLVKENAIRSFENWEDPRNIKLLEMIDCSEPHLKPYLDQVIQDLKGFQ